MARMIDDLIDTIRETSWLTPIEREVLATRIDLKPSDDEIDAARARLYKQESAAWDEAKVATEDGDLADEDSEDDEDDLDDDEAESEATPRVSTAF